MRFSTLATLSVYALATAALHIPSTTHNDIIARNPGSPVTSTGTSVGIDAEVDLSVFTSVSELTCLNSAVNIFATYGTSLSASVKLDILTKATTISSWSSNNIATLDAALNVLISGASLKDTAHIAICAKAQVDVTIGVQAATCLRAFIGATVTASLDVSVSAKLSIFAWSRQHICGYSHSQYLSLIDQISLSIHAHTSVGTSVGTSSGSIGNGSGSSSGGCSSCCATCSGSHIGVVDVRAKLLVYVQQLFASSSVSVLAKIELFTIITTIRLWLVGSTVTQGDWNTCWAVMQKLKTCGSGYDAVVALGLDLSVFGKFGAGHW